MLTSPWLRSNSNVVRSGSRAKTAYSLPARVRSPLMAMPCPSRYVRAAATLGTTNDACVWPGYLLDAKSMRMFWSSSTPLSHTERCSSRPPLLRSTVTASVVFSGTALNPTLP